MTALQWVQANGGYEIHETQNWQNTWRQFPSMTAMNAQLATQALKDLEADLVRLESGEAYRAFLNADREFQTYFIDVVEHVSRTVAKPRLAQQAAGFLYRLTPTPSLIPAENTPSSSSIESEILAFKVDVKRRVMKPGEEIILTPEDKDVAKLIAGYPRFATLLLNDKKLAEGCFKWCIRDNLPVQVFIYFPQLAKDIQDAALSRRLNHFFPNMLQLTEDVSQTLIEAEMEEQKFSFYAKVQQVTLPIASELKSLSPERVDLLNKDPQIQFPDGTTMVVSELFADFKARKDKALGSLEVIDGALRLWGPSGSFTSGHIKIDTTKPRWWEELHPHKVMTTEQVKATVIKGLTKEEDRLVFMTQLTEEKAIRRAVTTTGTLESTTLENHALVEVFLPMGDGKWAFYPFGFFPQYFPKGFLEAMPFLAVGQPGTIRYPDTAGILGGFEEFYYTQLVPIKRAEGTLERIGKSIAATQRGILNIPWLNQRFHVRVQNCAHWTQEILDDGDEPFPDLFSIPSEEVDAKSRLSRFILEAFDGFVWPPLLAYRGKLFEFDPPIPVGLAQRLVNDPMFDTFSNLTLQDS